MKPLSTLSLNLTISSINATRKALYSYDKLWLRTSNTLVQQQPTTKSHFKYTVNNFIEKKEEECANAR